MRFMMMIKATKDFEAGAPPSAALTAGMARLTAEAVRSGALLAAEGLLPSAHGVRLQCIAGKRSATDGPFAETKELLGGFAIVQAKSRAEAIELAQRVVDVHVDAGVTEIELEIRPLLGDPQFAAAS